MDDRLQNAPVGVLEVSPDGTVTDINEVAQSLIGSTGSAVGAPLPEVFPRSVEDSLLIAIEGDSTTESSFEEYYPDLECNSYAETSRAIRDYLGPYAGYAQTYIFHYRRAGLDAETPA